MSRIEWTDVTWNPVVGCEAVSPGCDNCYAANVASRQMQPAHEGLTIGRKWNGSVRLLPARLDEPMRWRKPRRVFVGSMTDIFHRNVPDRFLLGLWGTMALAPQHTFQILTKRPQRMASFVAGLPDWGQQLPNVWLGTSIESDTYTWRANHLRNTPAAVRFLSCEPLLGPLTSLDLTGIGWVIVGGESGPGARPMHPGWVRDLRDRCAAAGVPFLFKQWGGWSSRWLPDGKVGTHRVRFDGTVVENTPTCLMSNEEIVTRVGKKAAGRMLDGRTWDEFPASATPAAPVVAVLGETSECSPADGWTQVPGGAS